jgi:hypothetical protein
LGILFMNLSMFENSLFSHSFKSSPYYSQFSSSIYSLLLYDMAG